MTSDVPDATVLTIETLGPDDGDIYIWAMSWEQWKAKSVG